MQNSNSVKTSYISPPFFISLYILTRGTLASNITDCLINKKLSMRPLLAEFSLHSLYISLFFLHFCPELFFKLPLCASVYMVISFRSAQTTVRSVPQLGLLRYVTAGTLSPKLVVFDTFRAVRQLVRFYDILLILIGIHTSIIQYRLLDGR